MATITFGPGGIRAKGTQAVYTKAKWSDTWTAQPNLHCIEAVWSAAPSMPTASFSWLYGSMKPFNTSAFGVVDKLAASDRVFVKVTYETDTVSETRDWYGILESASDLLGGAKISGSSSIDFGNQVWTAYGMEKLLADHEIISAVTEDLADTTKSVRNERPPVFNRNGLPNRSKNKIDGAYVFGIDPEAAEFWTTADIVEYLLRYASPVDKTDEVKIKFHLPPSHKLTRWDRPEIQQEGYTTYDLLDRLVNRRRLMLWQLYVTDVGADQEVWMRTETMLASELALDFPGALPISANGSQRHLSFDTDQMTSATLKSSVMQKVDQVVVRGARRRSVGTFSIYNDNNLEAGWSTTQETEYTAAATGASGYALLTIEEKITRNAEARAMPEFENVFSFLVVPKGWNREVGDGLGGVKNPLFPIEGSTKSFPVYYPDLELAQTLPLIIGVDYSAVSPNAWDGLALPDVGKRQEAGPIIIFRIPGDDDPPRYRKAEDIGVDAEHEITEPSEFNRFGCTVTVPVDTKGFKLNVFGTQQHVLEGKTFGYLTEDVRLGEWSMKSQGTFLATLAIYDDRYCEGRWPKTLTSSPEAVRRKVIWAGDQYRKDYVAPGTVTGVGIDGQLLKNALGGYIPVDANGDDEHVLETAAKIAASWYTVPHFVLSLTSGRLKAASNINVCDLITGIGDLASSSGHRTTINSPVTQVAFRSPLGTPSGSENATMEIQTWAGELDPLLLLPPTAARA